MIWLHCGDRAEITTTQSLATRLIEYGDAVRVLITADPDHVPLFLDMPTGVNITTLPPDTPAKSRAFIAQWAPRQLIWNGGAVRPILLRNIQKQGVSATLINARNETLFSGSAWWMPGASRTAVMPFNRILTADGATATRLIRRGVARAKVEATGPILEEPIALPHDQNELTVLVEALGTRPLWFAADVVPAEIAQIATAHLTASRKSHRLILLMSPRDINSGAAVAQALRDVGLKVGVRSQGDDPLPEHQAYVADIEDELGLWYRIAPLTFMGGTLSGGGGALSPFAPISLGSAIVHGPQKKPFETRYARLADAEASREIRSAAELGIAVGALISPEHTARMALAGWTEMTQNAAIVNELVLEAVESVQVAS